MSGDSSDRAAPARRWAVVLGASTGSGAAIARALAREPGLDIFGVHRGNHTEAAAELADEVEAMGRRIVWHLDDAGSAPGAARGAEPIADACGPGSVKVFVHSIASASLGHFLSPRDEVFSPRQFETTFDRMAHSFVHWVRELFHGGLLAPEARLLGLSNSLHESAVNNCGMVAASKAALEMYVRYLAIELGPFGHRVNLLKFGTVITPALRKVFDEREIANMERAHAEIVPAGRMCTLEEVGAFVSLLAGDAASWFNGASIDFTGGMTLRLLDHALRMPDDSG